MPTTDQVRAVAAIRKIGTNALPFLLRWVGDPDRSWEGVNGFEALRELGAPAVNALLTLGTDPNEIIRARVVVALGWIGPQAVKAASFLRRQFKAGNFYAAESLAQIGSVGPEEVASILAFLGKDRRAYVQLQLVKALGEAGPAASSATETLLNLLKDPDAVIIRTSVDLPLLKQGIVTALGEIQDGRALPTLLRELVRYRNPKNQEQVGFRRALVRAVGRFGPEAEEARGIIEAIAARPKQNAIDKRIAEEALGRIGAGRL